MLKRKSYIIGSLVILLALLLGNFRTYLVLGASDLPTFYSGDKVIINRSAFDLTFPFSNLKIFKLGKPERGDMVLCKLKNKDNGHYWLKRIIGLPGDTIELKGNKIYINRIPLRYEFLTRDNFDLTGNMLIGEYFARELGLGLQHIISFSDKNGFLANYGPVVIKKDHYFVLGDNRDNSLDSRLLGCVHRTQIYGKYLMILSRHNS